jgi:type I restriction-modification system DNA methylase subunit
MTETWQQIAEHSDRGHAYMSGVNRSKERMQKNSETFTPTHLVIEMMQQMLINNPDVFAPGKTVLDPACGDGQLLVPVKWYKVLVHGMSEEDAVNDLYGVDIMPDNVEVCKRRLGGGNIICDNLLDPQTPEGRKWAGISTLEDFFV